METDITTAPAAYQATLDEMVAQVKADTERILDLRYALQHLEITGFSANREVTATLLGSGRFTVIDIDPDAVRDADLETIGSLVLTAVNDGLSRLHERGQAMFAPAGTESGA